MLGVDGGMVVGSPRVLGGRRRGQGPAQALERLIGAVGSGPAPRLKWGDC